MIEIESSVSHQLGKRGAVQRIQEFLKSLPQKFPQQFHQLRMQTRDNAVEVNFAAYGYLMQWKAVVTDTSVTVHGVLPDAAQQYKQKMLRTAVDRLSQAML